MITRVLVQRDLPLPAFQRFEGQREPGVGSAQVDGAWSWWAWAATPFVQLRARAEADGRWSLWAGYPGDRDSWRLRVKGATGSQLESLAEINAALRGDLLMPGGVFPSIPELLPPAETYEEWAERGRRERDRLRAQDERDRLQRIADTGEGYYPELLTEWPMSRAGHEGRPWRTISNDGTIEHRVERHPAWGHMHHLRYFVDGEAVAGLTLKAKRPWRGLQSATIQTVYTDPGHRRRGFARELLHEARRYFRVVKHSKELTGAGRKWKRGVGNQAGFVVLWQEGRVDGSFVPTAAPEPTTTTQILEVNEGMEPDERARLLALRPGQSMVLYGFVGSAFRVHRPRFDAQIARDRANEHDDRSFGPMEISVPRGDRARVGRALVRGGFTSLAESVVADGVVDMTGEGVAMVVLLDALLSSRSTAKAGSELAKALGAWKG